MTYRDDLDAALAKIKALEQALGGQTQGSSDLVAANKSLGLEKERLQERLAEAQAQIQDLRKRLYGQPASPSELEQLPTLASYNRALPDLTEPRNMRVVCPTCLVLGERVEMSKHSDAADSALGVTVICTRCGTLGVKRRK